MKFASCLLEQRKCKDCVSNVAEGAKAFGNLRPDFRRNIETLGEFRHAKISVNKTVVHHPVLILGYALSCATLRVVGITTRSVVQLSMPTQVCSLDDALGWITKLGCVVGLIVGFGCSNDLFAQEKDPAEFLLDIGIDLAQEAQVRFAGQQVNSKPQLLKQMRGLIQNELTIIGEMCGLELKQQQALADLAESEWKPKTNASIVKRTQEHVYGTIDLDSLAERIVRLWLESVATKEQLEKYDQELAGRMKWRQKAVISKVLDTLEVKLNLSGVQMDQIEAILNEKWKDRWYRSLEATFDDASLLPEIRPSWITPVLSESQRAALSTRDQQQRFGAQQASSDSPSLRLEERFRVGDAVSSDSIDTEPPKGNIIQEEKEIEKPKAIGEGTFDEKKR